MKYLLASQSPRRQALLKQMEVDYQLVPIECSEAHDGIPAAQVAETLALRKSHAYLGLQEGECLITADTTVICDDRLLNKPSSVDDARAMLQLLSDNSHQVITGVCLRTSHQTVHFSEKTTVYVDSLTDREINNYIQKYQPFDKAGSYGIQDWFGLTKVRAIEGCYYNVVGLPCARLYKAIQSLE